MATEFADPQADRAALSPEGRTFELTKSVGFEAAHRLPGRGPRDPYGRLHGHSFRIDATVSGEVAEGEAWVADFADIGAALDDVAARLDHQLLNEIEGLEAPTLERIAVWVSVRLKERLPRLSRVVVSRPSLNESCALRLD